MTATEIEAIEHLASCIAILAVELDSKGTMSMLTATDFNRKFRKYEMAIAECRKAGEKE